MKRSGGGEPISKIVSTWTLCTLCGIIFTGVIAPDSSVIASPNGDTEEEPELVLLQMLFRHGDRSPTKESLYANDTNDELWPQGFGQLTQIGMQQAFEYGKLLRGRYAEFLPDQYRRSEVYVQSTDVDRTLMTVQTLLTGLFPKQMRDWPPGIWQPIPIHTEEHDADHLFAHAPCTRTEDLKRDWTSTEPAAAKHIISKYKDLLRTLAQYANVSTLDDMHELSDTVYCESVHKKKQPVWLTDDIYQQLMDFRNESVQFTIISNGTARLFGGPALSEMTQNMEKKAVNASSYKLILFSAHDTNVISLGRAMGIMNNLQPPYLTSIIVELYRKNQEFFVKVLFDNHTDQSPYTQTITGCEALCPLEQFRTLLEHNMLPAGEREAACALPGVSDSSSSGVVTSDELVTILASTLMLLSVVTAAVTFSAFRSRQRRLRTTANLRYQQLLQEAGDDSDNEDH